MFLAATEKGISKPISNSNSAIKKSRYHLSEIGLSKSHFKTVLQTSASSWLPTIPRALPWGITERALRPFPTIGYELQQSLDIKAFQA